MNMVSHTAYRFRNATEPAHGAAEVFVHPRQPRITEVRTTLFGGEYNVIVKAQVCGSHKAVGLGFGVAEA
jgi:hypothetical protein